MLNAVDMTFLESRYCECVDDCKWLLVMRLQQSTFVGILKQSFCVGFSV